MAQVIVDSLMTRYQQRGTGSIVLFLHGWGDKSDTFNNLFDHLSKKHRVLALDLPGFGGTEPSKSAWNLDDYANFVQHFLNKINLPSIDVIIGHSNGGAIAIRGISLKILTTNRLILLASSGVRDNKGTSVSAKKTTFKIGKRISLLLPKIYQKKLRHTMYSLTDSDILAVPELEQTFRKIVAQDVQKDSKNITAPTLLIYGAEDTATPPVFGEIFQRNIYGSRLIIVNGAGHFIQHDAADIVQHEIDTFLGSNA